MSKFELVVCQAGEIHKVGASPLVMINGAVHTYASDDIDEPYRKEWGWQCCSPSEKEIYRHLYKHMLKGAVDALTKADEDDIRQDIIARRGISGEQCVIDADADAYTTYMMIPVDEFGISKEGIFYTICQRVMMDNPLLMFPFFPSFPDSVAVIKDSSGICQYVYSIVPNVDKCAQAREICREQISNIVEKVEEVYGIRPGDTLTVAQKAWVLKVIHDYLILHGNMDGKTVAWLLWTPYAVYDKRYKGNCNSYTMAFCAAARLYGIEAINMTGYVYIDTDTSKNGYEKHGDHAWVAVRLSDEAYGTYPQDPEKWSCIDVYWDEPAHEIGMGVTPDRKDVIWKYFLNPETINICSADDEKSGHSYRIVDASIAYGRLPVTVPVLYMTYDGDNIYNWEGDV